MDRSRAMKMAAAAGDGDDVQDRTNESIAQDSADGNDSNFNSESLIFPVFCGCSWAQKLQAPKGLRNFPKAIKLHDNRKDNYGRTCSQALHVPKGMCVELQACAMDPMQVFPARRRQRRRRGSGRTPRRTSSGAAPTCPPEGVFRCKRLMELH